MNNYQNYSDFDTVFKRFIPHNKVYQEMANLYLNSILLDYDKTTNGSPNQESQESSRLILKETENFLQTLSPNSIALLKKNSSSHDSNEVSKEIVCID